MLKNRFFQVSSKGIVVYNEKYYGSQASFNSYIEGFEKFKLEEDEKEAKILHESAEIPIISKIDEAVNQKNLENSLKICKNSDEDAIITCNIEEPQKITPPKNANYSSKVGRQALETLQQLGVGNNLEKFLEAHGLQSNNNGFSIPELKSAFDKFLSQNEEEQKRNEILKWTNQIEDLKSLRNEKELEKWLESRGLPAANVSVPAVQKELAKYFQNADRNNAKNIVTPKIAQPNWGKRSGNKNSAQDAKNPKSIAASEEKLVAAVKKLKEKNSKIEDFLDSDVNNNGIPTAKRVPRDFGPCMKVEDFNGRSLLLREDTLANKLWEDFKGMSTPKQIAVVVGITVVTAALGFVSWQILLLAFPSVFQVNRYWTEVLAQWFIQRQESTFHLLQHTAQNSKPLSTAWANQYLLWKYI